MADRSSRRIAARGPCGPRIVCGPVHAHRFAPLVQGHWFKQFVQAQRFTKLALCALLLGSSASAQGPAPSVPLPNATVSDSLRRATVVWGNVTPLLPKGRVAAVPFRGNGCH